MPYSNRIDLLKSLGLKNPSIVEVGVLWGDFSAQILSELKPSSLLLVDLWAAYDYGYADPHNKDQAWHDANYRGVESRFSGNPEVTILRELSTRAADFMRMMGGLYDIVYIDANHSYKSTLADLKAWAPCVRAGGYLAGHDYVNRLDFGVIDAVTEFCKEGWVVQDVTEEEWPSYVLRRVG